MAAMATIEEYASLFAYIVRSLLDGGTVAAHFVEGLVADAEAFLDAGVGAGTVRPSLDPAGRARLLTAITVGMIVMAHLEAGPELADPGGVLRGLMDRAALAGLELYTTGLFTDDSYLRAYMAQTEGR